jgi:hypothetical protein
MTKIPQRKMIHVFATPLERAVGFYISERTYDLLTISEQIIIDMLIIGYDLVLVSQLLGIRPRELNQVLVLIRTKLAVSELKFHLDMKVFYKETQEYHIDEKAFGEGFGFDDLLEKKTYSRNGVSKADEDDE